MKKQQILKKVKYWQNILNLNAWDIEVRFDKVKVKETAEFECHGRTELNAQYLLATITFPKPDKLEESTIIHELLHIVLGETHGYIASNCEENMAWYDYFNERTICMLERIVGKLAKK